MESTEFCGTACHTVMEPEYTTYKRSPHARVRCVECHIGEGADWFVKSKLSGSWQLVSVTFDLYQRPIGVPVHNLRPARETCEQCHWPNKFVGDRFKVITHFAEDEANTETKTVLVVKVGRPPGRASHGIHWHVDPDHVVRYRSDEKRQKISRWRWRRRTARSSTSSGPAASSPEAARPPSGARWTASTATTGRPTSTASPSASSTPRSSTGGSTPHCRSSAARG